MFQLTIWSLAPLATAFFALWAFALARRRLHVPGGLQLRNLFLLVFCWSAAQGIETLVIQAELKVLASKLAYLGIVFIPVVWFQFALTFGQRLMRVNNTTFLLLSAIPVVTLVLLFTNAQHALMWTNWSVVTLTDYVGLTTSHGLWFFVHAFYSYALVLMATTIVVFSLHRFRQSHEAILSAIFAPLIGVIANVFSVSALNPTPWVDYSNVGFLIGILLMQRGLLNMAMFKHLPVVRDRVVEELTDPILVIDHTGNILDVNRSALKAWHRERESIMGAPVNNLVEHLSLEHLRNSAIPSEATIAGKSFEVATTPLDVDNPQTDAVLVFRDVTERIRTEQKLRELKDELERMAHTDALTNLFNRRYFMQRLHEEFERIRRHNSTLSVLIFDLDHFKSINDTHGHDVGDEVLVAVSNVTERLKRVTDVACRLGGEEFALLLPETEKRGALQMAHRLREGIEDYPYLDLLGHSLQVTASVGVATISTHSKTPENVLKVADRAHIRDKNSTVIATLGGFTQQQCLHKLRDKIACR